jgi:hypothetical protein
MIKPADRPFEESYAIPSAIPGEHRASTGSSELKPSDKPFTQCYATSASIPAEVRAPVLSISLVTYSGSAYTKARVRLSFCEVLPPSIQVSSFRSGISTRPSSYTTVL